MSETISPQQPDALAALLRATDEASTRTDQKNITYIQAYEISSRVEAKEDSKGVVHPSVRVAITRHLESGDGITELIQADISMGVEETMAAVQEIHRKAVQ